ISASLRFAEQRWSVEETDRSPEMIVRGITDARRRHLVVVRTVWRIVIRQISVDRGDDIENIPLTDHVLFNGRNDPRQSEFHLAIGTWRPLAQVRRVMSDRIIDFIQREDQ